MPRTIPISKYVPKKFGRIEMKNLSVFKFEAIPKSSPIDLNVSALSEESGWSLSDRLRLWHTLNDKSPLPATRLTIRKLELEEQALVLCHGKAPAIDLINGLFSNTTGGPKTFEASSMASICHRRERRLLVHPGSSKSTRTHIPSYFVHRRCRQFSKPIYSRQAVSPESDQWSFSRPHGLVRQRSFFRDWWYGCMYQQVCLPQFSK